VNSVMLVILADFGYSLWMLLSCHELMHCVGLTACSMMHKYVVMHNLVSLLALTALLASDVSCAVHLLI
jgi:hypothetical protein